MPKLSDLFANVIKSFKNFFTELGFIERKIKSKSEYFRGDFKVEMQDLKNNTNKSMINESKEKAMNKLKEEQSNLDLRVNKQSQESTHSK